MKILNVMWKWGINNWKYWISIIIIIIIIEEDIVLIIICVENEMY